MQLARDKLKHNNNYASAALGIIGLSKQGLSLKSTNVEWVAHIQS